MLRQVIKLLDTVQSVNEADQAIDLYRTRYRSNNSWSEVVQAELRKKDFSQLEKVELRRAIETLEHIENLIT